MLHDPDYFVYKCYRCKLCGKQFSGTSRYPRKALFAHLTEYHGLKKKINQPHKQGHWEQLPNIAAEFEFKCEICGKRYSAGNKEWLSKYRDAHISEVHCISYQDYYDLYLRKDGEGFCPVCGKKLTLRKGRFYRGHCSGACILKRPEMIAKATEQIIRLNNDLEFCKKRDETASRTTCYRKRANNIKGFGVGCTYKGILFQSKYEAEFAKACDRIGIKWHYESTTFYVGLKGRKQYTPDFYLPGYNLWLELTGNGPGSKDVVRKFKIERKLKEYGVDPIILYNKDISSFVNLFRPLQS